MKWLEVLQISKKEKILYLIGCIFSIMTGLITLRITYLLKNLVDSKSSFNNLFLFLVLGLVLFIIDAGSQYLISLIGNQVVFNSRNNIWKKISDWTDSKDDSSEMAGHLINDSELIENFIISTIPQSINSVIVGSGSLVMLFVINSKMSLEVIGICLLLLFIMQPFSRILSKISKRIQEDKAELINIASQLRGQVKTIKSYNAQDYAFQKFDEQNRQLFQDILNRIKIFSIYSPFLNILILFMIIIVVWLGNTEVRSGNLTVGSATIFVVYMTQLINPIMQLSQLVAHMGMLNGGVERLLEYNQAIPEKNGIKKIDEIINIAFDNVSFAYDNQENIIENVNLAFQKGTYISIVGESGVGKSTLLDLLEHNYVPSKGRILINGIDLEELNIKTLRNKISYVSQEPTILSGTIRELLDFNQQQHTETSLWNVLDTVELSELIRNLPRKLDSKVDEYGGNLSGGQMQRISLARGLLKAGDVLLLDESFANIDEETCLKIKLKIAAYAESHKQIVIEVIHNLNRITPSSIVYRLADKKLEILRSGF
ncbi:ABC transporter ATP-binding protein [Streptococcus mutans]|uniref:ABC transporter ATP-binding protein n=1 Tax=Streptococcus mutans TaxID=1309 RepID=UPI0002B51C5D|nr:ABC transporter ATP-binding protein [Streptococcus mutans]EMC29260.1 ABC transporter, ATP-binding and permease protein [Streptococcus mutans U2A]EMC55500.1 ABC transporter, ATP-binding and permease protein [Streptococcus mutans OMZ175]QFG44960.1 ABC transporter transmembrane region family protein [Streptococcus mutans]QZS44598.1 ABC transporter ATP-binding protein/permease [Streptococcus mutans OMZ175]